VATAGTLLGIYRLIEPIGAGGMGEVWKAEDTRLGRTVAVKILPLAIASDPEAIARMRREARTAAQLNHPNIAHIYAFEEDGERLFIVMELVEGQPLSRLIERGPLPEADVARIGRGVAEGLAEAHAKGVVHRDIKPDNIMVAGNRTKVLDFGIAKQFGEGSKPNDPTAFITQAGMILGTIQYMSPEQALGQPLDNRTDIFSLGVVLYQAVSGRLPFKGATINETMTQIVRDDPPPLTSVSPLLANIIARCLQKKREDRYANAGDVAAALEAKVVTEKSGLVAAAPAPIKKWPIFVGAAAVLLGCVVAFGLLKKDEARTPASASPVSAPAGTPTATSTPLKREAKPQPEPQQPVPQEREPATQSVADRFFARGMDDLAAGRRMEARRAFASAFRMDPANRKAQLGVAIIDRDWRRARELVREIDPGDADLGRLREFIEEKKDERRKKRGKRDRD
jgi:serine/threonine protein kinase